MGSLAKVGTTTVICVLAACLALGSPRPTQATGLRAPPFVKIEVGGSPVAIALGLGAIWVADRGAVIRIDPHTNRVVARIPVAERVSSLAVGGGSVWAAANPDFGPRAVVRIDPLRNRVTARAALPDTANPIGVAFGNGSVWVASQSPPERVFRIDPRSLSVASAIALQGYRINAPSEVAFGEGAVWAANCSMDAFGRGSVVRLDPSSSRALASTETGCANDLVVGGHAVWTTGLCEGGNCLIRIDPRTTSITLRVRTLRARELAFGAGAVWGSVGGRITRIDARSGRIGRSLLVSDPADGNSPIVVSADSVWVADGGGLVLRIPARAFTTR